jgi:metallophosphoesterase superfamily enzyme
MTDDPVNWPNYSDDAAQLERLRRDPPETMLVVSDLHIGIGREVTTGRISRRENFLADAAFADMLDAYRPTTEQRTLLILNGDTFDFLRILDTPDPEASDEMSEWQQLLERWGKPKPLSVLKSSIDKHERVFGLKTHDFKSAWKLHRIAQGHPTFFGALASWVTHGGLVLLIKGNHDLELHWELVRTAIRDAISTAGAEQSAVHEAVLFSDHNILIDNVYLEHGHRFEPLTAVRGDNVLPQAPEELNLPIGSFMNRYVVNRIERLEPFLDNVKPYKDILWTLVKRHPLRSFGIVWRAWRLIKRALQKRAWKDSLAFTFWFLALLVPIVTVALIVVAFAVPTVGAWVVDILGKYRTPLSILGALFPFLVGAARDLIPKKKPAEGEDEYAAGAHTALGHALSEPWPKTAYAVLGHTHMQDVQRLSSIEGSEVVYLNTGTWAPLWLADRPDLKGKVLHPVIEFRWTDSQGYRHRYLEWLADACRSRESSILTKD